MQKEPQVKIIKLINGDDIVCVLPAGELQLPENGPLIRLDKPLQIKYIPQITPMGFRDYIALIRWTNYTGDQIVTIPKDKIMTITNASLEMTGNYTAVCKNYNSLDKPKRDKGYHRKEFSSEENKKLNEIFREFDDDEETPPTIH
jgi:hypothetical protein